MFYIILDADRYHLELKPKNGRLLSRIGEMLKADAQEKFPVNHPDFDYPGPDILAFTSTKTGRHVNTVVMSNGSFDWTRPSSWNAMLDRSPCGSGTAAIMTNRVSKGMLSKDERFENFSIIGSKFEAVVIDSGKLQDGRNFIQPKITGLAYVTGYNQIILDDHDPFQAGFTVGDIWA